MMFEMEPNVCLKLYQQHVSPDVRMEDLKGGEFLQIIYVNEITC